MSATSDMNGRIPAHPCDAVSWQTGNSGLTKREDFAGRAMQALLGRSDATNATEQEMGRFAVRYADALLAALEEKPDA